MLYRWGSYASFLTITGFKEANIPASGLYEANSSDPMCLLSLRHRRVEWFGPDIYKPINPGFIE